MKSRWLYWLPAVGYAAVIFAVSSIPARSMPEGRFWDFDKLIHAGEYAVLAALLWWALARTTKLGRWSRASVAALLAGLYGISDELHQSLVPGRAASVYDAIADFAGAVTAALLLAILARGRRG
ncbi:MAG: VanZ family protein [Deltaproteobacteria bacterium]|nr:VanZ family protein [Deltaproteobacteria bacterium]